MSVFMVDVDGTLTLPQDITKIEDYSKAFPRLDVIRKVNELFYAGHKIVLYTARGNTLSDNINTQVRPDLEKWLCNNNVFYHELIFGKLSYPKEKTYYVGDEVLTIKQFVESSNFEISRKANTLLEEESC